MTMVKCMRCGIEIYYLDLVWSSIKEEDYAGLCPECFHYEVLARVDGKKLYKELEKKYEDKINIIIKENNSGE